MRMMMFCAVALAAALYLAHRCCWRNALPPTPQARSDTKSKVLRKVMPAVHGRMLRLTPHEEPQSPSIPLPAASESGVEMRSTAKPLGIRGHSKGKCYGRLEEEHVEGGGRRRGRWAVGEEDGGQKHDAQIDVSEVPEEAQWLY